MWAYDGGGGGGGLMCFSPEMLSFGVIKSQDSCQNGNMLNIKARVGSEECDCAR